MYEYMIATNESESEWTNKRRKKREKECIDNRNLVRDRYIKTESVDKYITANN